VVPPKALRITPQMYRKEGLASARAVRPTAAMATLLATPTKLVVIAEFLTVHCSVVKDRKATRMMEPRNAATLP